MRKLLLSLVAMLMVHSPAQAADPIAMPPQLKTFLLRSDQSAEVSKILSVEWKNLAGECSSVNSDRSNVVIESLPKFDSTGDPVSGQWRIISHLSGCGKTLIINILYSFDKTATLRRVVLLPGTTLANPQLQKDSLFYAAAGMNKLVKLADCKDIKVVDTNFISLDKKGATLDNPQGSPWTEQWTVRACKATGVVTMHFIPDATGVTIKSSASETKKL